MANEAALRPGELKEVLLREIEAADLGVGDLEEVGTILEVKDGVALVYGLTKAMAGEMLEFHASGSGETVTGLALNLEEDNIGAVILGNYLQLKEGDEVRRTGRVLEVPVGRALVGRVVDPLGRPLDGLGPIAATSTRFVEMVAPGIVVRQPVKEPLQTGLEGFRAALRAERHTLKRTLTDPRIFYNKEDLWRVAQSAARGAAAPMSPYYTIMKLAEVGEREEFILMVPFTPARKDNMIAWMAARCDYPDYGKVLVFTFPKQKLVYGPQQIESRIDQDPGISQELTLWGQGGSTVIRGTLLVVPVLNSVLYVEPLYLAAEAGGGLPQLKRVIVAYSDHVVMADTLDAALSNIFSGAVTTSAAPPLPGGAAAPVPGKAPGATASDTQALIRDANQHYQRALQLQRQGDWAGYGEEVKKLGELLNRLASTPQAAGTK